MDKTICVTTDETSTVGRRIVGSIVGLLAGCVVGPVAVFLAVAAVFGAMRMLGLGHYTQLGDYEWLALGINLAVGVIGGATVGTAAGASIAQRLCRRRG